ncbi:MAG: hypothetical protein WBD95_26570 [Xanthobacteraceae bacterium]
MIDTYAKEKLLRHKKWANLENAAIVRRGLTRRQWYRYETNEGISLKGGSGPNKDALAISFLIPGGRKPDDTVVEVAIKSNDFRTIVALMSSTDRDATLQAMAEELRYQLCGKSK